MREYPLDLKDYGIHREEYGMLRYFCLLYPRKKRQLADLMHAAPDPERKGGSRTPAGDPVGSVVAKREKLLRDCEMIEQSAIEAAGGGGDDPLYQHLLRNVTSKKKPPMEEIPCGRRQFYMARKRFYILLFEKLNGL